MSRSLFFIMTPNDSIWPYLTFTQNFVWAFEGHWEPWFIGATLIAAAPVCRVIQLALGHPYAAYLLMPCRMDVLFLGVRSLPIATH
jgi:hypothetical protein